MLSDWMLGPGVSVHWGHVLVPGNPGYDGIEGLTKGSSFSWVGSNAAWWSSRPGSGICIPWDGALILVGAEAECPRVWESCLTCTPMRTGGLLPDELYLMSGFYSFAMAIGAKHAQVRRDGSVSVGETATKCLLRICISTFVIIQNFL